MNGTRVTSSTNAIVHRIHNVGVLKMYHDKFKRYTLLARELCVLQKLAAFDWSQKVICANPRYMITTDVGTTRCEDELPPDYDQQIAVIVADMQSVGVRQNDMIKGGRNTDVVVNVHGRVSLTDFGWGTIDQRLGMACNISGHQFQSSGTHPPNVQALQHGFHNSNETRHTRIRCQNRTLHQHLL